MDILIAGQHLDLTSLLSGAVVARTIEAALVGVVKQGPGLVVSLVRRRVQALAVAGKIDATTMKLLTAYGEATFDWVDAELPDAAGPEKMAAALDRLAAVPYLGVLVRADRAGAQQVLQAAYDAIKAEAKADGSKAAAAPAPAAPAAAPPPAGQG